MKNKEHKCSGEHTAVDNSVYRFRAPLPEGVEPKDVHWTTAIFFGAPFATNGIVFDNGSGAVIFVYSVVDPKLSFTDGEDHDVIGIHSLSANPDYTVDIDDLNLPDEIKLILDVSKMMDMPLPSQLQEMLEEDGVALNAYLAKAVRDALNDSGFKDTCSPLAIFDLPIPAEMLNIQHFDETKSEMAVAAMLPESIDLNLD